MLVVAKGVHTLLLYLTIMALRAHRIQQSTTSISNCTNDFEQKVVTTCYEIRLDILTLVAQDPAPATLLMPLPPDFPQAKLSGSVPDLCRLALRFYKYPKGIVCLVISLRSHVSAKSAD